jgi:hypothetical protein
MSNNPIPLGCPNPADLRAQAARADATQVEAENVGNSQELPGEPPEITQQLRNVNRRPKNHV